MPIKKGEYRRWWGRHRPPKVLSPSDEKQRYYQRQYSDARLTKILSCLDPPDALRLAEMIYEQSVKARRLMKGLPALRRQIIGRGPGPAPRFGKRYARELFEIYEEIVLMVRSGLGATAIATELGRPVGQIRYALDNRRGVASKARGIVLVGLRVRPSDATTDDYIGRLLKSAS